MSGIFASLTLEGKRIRPEKSVIKGGIFPPNYSYRYQAVAADRSGEENTFKFYQMDISLRAADAK